MSTPLPFRPVFWAVVFSVVLLLVLLIVPFLGRVTANAHRSVALSDIRRIGQASLVYALDHHDNLPAASDVWDYARILADDAGINDPRLWLAPNDPAAKGVTPPPHILAGNTTSPRALAPAFRELKPSVAVPLGKLNSRMPATTPIAWTRGLLSDGTWSAHSPHGTDGGFIMFLGGNVAFFKNLNATGDELVRFDGKGPTANILDALPPGTRIGEYTPTAEEQSAWAEAITWRRKLGALFPSAPQVFLAALWLPFLAIAACRLLKKQYRGGLTVLVWPVVFSALLFALTRDCW